MNLALSAIIILLLLLPAFTFKLGIALYAGSRKTEPSTTKQLHQYLIRRNVINGLSKLNFNDTVFIFSLVPVILHFVAISIVPFNHQVRFDLLLNIFAGKENVVGNLGNASFQIQLKHFLLYSLLQSVAGFVIAFFLSDILMPSPLILRALIGNNNWFRTFTGFSLPEADRARLHSVLIEALTLTKETTVIYSGYLSHYELLGDNNAIAYITLHSPSRRDLRVAQLTTKNPNTITESVSSYDTNYGTMINIPGNTLTLQGKDILNVNVTYLELVADPNSPTPGAKKLVPFKIKSGFTG